MEAAQNGTAEAPRLALPRYKSHKIVEAAKIEGVLVEPGQVVLAVEIRGPNGEFGTGRVVVRPSWLEREMVTAVGQRNLVGGYYVRYEDGYESWSPASTFEDGYVPEEERPAAPAVGVIPRRTLHGHQVNPANDKLQIAVLDEPGSSGACHLYDIRGFCSSSNPSDPFVARYGSPADHATILFQNGPINEVVVPVDGQPGVT